MFGQDHVVVLSIHGEIHGPGFVSGKFWALKTPINSILDHNQRDEIRSGRNCFARHRILV
jgi:hypothetical protein